MLTLARVVAFGEPDLAASIADVRTVEESLLARVAVPLRETWLSAARRLELTIPMAPVLSSPGPRQSSVHISPVTALMAATWAGVCFAGTFACGMMGSTSSNATSFGSSTATRRGVTSRRPDMVGWRNADATRGTSASPTKSASPPGATGLGEVHTSECSAVFRGTESSSHSMLPSAWTANIAAAASMAPAIASSSTASSFVRFLTSPLRLGLLSVQSMRLTCAVRRAFSLFRVRQCPCRFSYSAMSRRQCC
mmetsp:Transcript_26769/g.61691  ORF Transcript_26769/g.61691 Transcript_26769/m.61691 type:complete len:252 (-) Transcript_26769:200-955(-)